MKAKKSGMNCERKGGDLEKYCEIFKNEMWFIRKKEREKKADKSFWTMIKLAFLFIDWERLRIEYNVVECQF